MIGRKHVWGGAEVNVAEIVKDLVDFLGVDCTVCVDIKQLAELSEAPDVELGVRRTSPRDALCLQRIFDRINHM